LFTSKKVYTFRQHTTQKILIEKKVTSKRFIQVPHREGYDIILPKNVHSKEEP
jgi:hypothetical protein